MLPARASYWTEVALLERKQTIDHAIYANQQVQIGGDEGHQRRDFHEQGKGFISQHFEYDARLELPL